MSAYIVIACVECYRRYPEMIDEITAAATPEELGRAGHELTTQIDPVHMWAVPNFFLIGRKVLLAGGHGRPGRRRARGSRPCSTSGTRAAARTASTTARTRPPTPTGRRRRTARYVDEIVARASRSRDAERAAISRLNALLTSYLFLLWFDTRSGYQDTGPYPLADGRTLLLRRVQPARCVALPVERRGSARRCRITEVLGAFVLRDAQLRVTDFGTSVTQAGGLLAARRGVRVLRRRRRARSCRSTPTGRDALGDRGQDRAEAAVPE